MSSKRKVRDTNAPGEREAFMADAMLSAMGGGHGSEAVIRQEKDGQGSFVASEQLPVDGTKGKEDVYARVGIKLGPVPTSGDTLFRDAELPEGWEKKSAGDSRWNNLVDAQGRVRASMFYKAAFYDRSAHISLNRRYTVQRDYDAPDGQVRWQALDTGETVIHQVEFDVPSKSADSRAFYLALDKIEKESGDCGGCCAWMDENYPEWKDPAAHWE